MQGSGTKLPVLNERKKTGHSQSSVVVAPEVQLLQEAQGRLVHTEPLIMGAQQEQTVQVSQTH